MNRSGMTKQIQDAPASRGTTKKRDMKMGGILKKVVKGPKILRKINPIASVLGAKKHGGSMLKAALDPAGLIHKKNVTSAKGAAEKEARSPEAKAAKRRKMNYDAAGMSVPGMKKGGQVHCRGGGAATRGTRFGGKD
jgi:hypothetical protein